MEMNNIIVDPTYKQWVVDIERRFRQQQIKAVVQVNSCKIEFYWSLGRDICEMDVERRYGKGVIKALSQDLRRNIPEVKGLTPGGLYYCKRFYLLYNKVFEMFPQLEETSVPQLGEILKPMHSALSVAQKYPLNIFAIPWGHHKVLIDNFQSEPQKALFYAAKTLQNNWSRAVLENMIGDKGKNNGLYDRQGNSVNNFLATIPSPSGDLANELINDPINLSFVRVKEKLDEDNLKKAMVRHVNELLLALGSGFAYMGKEYLLSVAGKEQFTDLLFYNTRIHAYLVVEVKISEFESSFLGQLSGYMTLVNHTLKTEIDNPTIGLLICRSKNNMFAQYCLEGYSQPIAVTAYEGVEILPSNFNETLPSIEDLEKEITENA